MTSRDKAKAKAATTKKPTKTKAVKPTKPIRSKGHRAPLTRPPADTQPEKKADAFPLISVFEQDDMDAARTLIETDLQYQERIAILKSSRDEIKEALEVLAVQYKVPGMRWGNYAVYYRGRHGKETFSRDKFIKGLLENGVPAKVIERCKTAATGESKPYLDLQVKDLTKSDRADRGDDA